MENDARNGESVLGFVRRVKMEELRRLESELAQVKSERDELQRELQIEQRAHEITATDLIYRAEDRNIRPDQQTPSYWMESARDIAGLEKDWSDESEAKRAEVDG